MFEDIKVGDKVIGVHRDMNYFILTVKSVTLTRFTTDTFETFLKSNGVSWSKVNGGRPTRAIPYTMRLGMLARSQEEERADQEKRDKLISSVYCLIQDVRRTHLAAKSTEELESILEIVVNLTNKESK